MQDDDGPNRIHESDRANIKTFIVTLMLKSSPAIQKQLSDAVSIIGKYDFPEKWPQLIDEMVDKFKSGDFHIINGVLQTAHSIFKRYRYEFKSQKLWEEIKLVLDKFAKPLTELLTATMGLAKAHENNEAALRVLYGSIVLITKVFYSLNAQDLPEFFEDNMQTWMNAFHELLITDIACLHTGVSRSAFCHELLSVRTGLNLFPFFCFIGCDRMTKRLAYWSSCVLKFATIWACTRKSMTKNSERIWKLLSRMCGNCS